MGILDISIKSNICSSGREKNTYLCQPKKYLTKKWQQYTCTPVHLYRCGMNLDYLCYLYISSRTQQKNQYIFLTLKSQLGLHTKNKVYRTRKNEAMFTPCTSKNNMMNCNREALKQAILVIVCLFRFSLNTLLKSCYNVNHFSRPRKSSKKKTTVFKRLTHYCQGIQNCSKQLLWNRFEASSLNSVFPQNWHP